MCSNPQSFLLPWALLDSHTLLWWCILVFRFWCVWNSRTQGFYKPKKMQLLPSRSSKSKSSCGDNGSNTFGPLFCNYLLQYKECNGYMGSIHIIMMNDQLRWEIIAMCQNAWCWEINVNLHSMWLFGMNGSIVEQGLGVTMLGFKFYLQLLVCLMGSIDKGFQWSNSKIIMGRSVLPSGLTNQPFTKLLRALSC